MGYAPYAPLHTLKPFAPALWIVDGPALPYRLGGVDIPCPTRMTLVQLPDGTLWVHSPIEPSDELTRTLLTLGPVAHIVVPNGLHTTHATRWTSDHPSARVHAPPLGAKAGGVLPPYSTLDAPPPEWGGAFDMIVLRGVGFIEAVFLHVPSRTMIVTDLMQRFEEERVAGPLARFLLRTGGATGPDAGPSIEVRAALLPHRRALRTATARMLAWRPERIVIAHGPCIEEDAVGAIERAFGRRAIGR